MNKELYTEINYPNEAKKLVEEKYKILKSRITNNDDMIRLNIKVYNYNQPFYYLNYIGIT